MSEEIEIKLVTKAEFDELDDLSTALDDIKSKADEGLDIESNASEVSDDFEELDTTINQISRDSVDEVTNSTDELGDSVNSADNEVENLGNDLSLLEAGALLDISSKIQGIGANAEGMSQDMNTASISVGHLATQTSIAEPQLISLINNISNATFPQKEALQYVTVLDQLGVSASNLGRSATDMDRINDAFGIGSDKVVSLTGNLYALGVPADNLQSSYGALAYAQSNVAGGVDRFSQVLQRLGPEFSEYGFNVDQAAVITGAATQKWGTGRKAMSNLSSALKEANGDTRALEQSLGLQTGALSDASQTTAQYAGNVQRLADEEAQHKTLLDQLNAAWEDARLSLSPVLAPLSSFMGIVGQAGGYAVGINGIMTLAKSMNSLREAEILSTIATKGMAAAQWLLNAAMNANPIMIIVTAIVILIGVLVYLYFNNEQVRNAINNLGATFQRIGQIMYTSIINAVNWIIGALQNLWTYIITLGGLLPSNVEITGNNIIDTILRVVAFIATLPIQLQIIFINILAKALGFGDNFVQRLITSAKRGATGFINQITSLPGKLANELNRMTSKVNEWAASLPGKFWEAGVNAVQNFLNALGIHSPGTMQRMLVWEITEMGKQVPKKGADLVSNIGVLGSDVVDAFDDFELSNKDISIKGTGGDSSSKSNVFNVQFTGCTFDKEERVNEILTILENYFSWDNNTAGRGV